MESLLVFVTGKLTIGKFTRYNSSKFSPLIKVIHSQSMRMWNRLQNVSRFFSNFECGYDQGSFPQGSRFHQISGFPHGNPWCNFMSSPSIQTAILTWYPVTHSYRQYNCKKLRKICRYNIWQLGCSVFTTFAHAPHTGLTDRTATQIPVLRIGQRPSNSSYLST